MKVVVKARLGKMLSTDEIFLVKQAMNENHKVIVVAEEDFEKSLRTHLNKLFPTLLLEPPKVVVEGTHKHKRACKQADKIIYDSKEDCKTEHPKKDIFLDTFDFVELRPCYDGMTENVIDNTKKMLLADNIQRNNEKLYYIDVVKTYLEKYQNFSEAVSRFAVDLMEFDNILTNNELALIEMPLEFETLIPRNAFRHIKFVYWRYEPMQVLSCCETLITDDISKKSLATGYANLIKKPVKLWDEVKNNGNKLRNDQTFSGLYRSSKIYNIGNSHLVLEKILRDNEHNN